MGLFTKKETRFEILSREYLDHLVYAAVLRDKQTGVQYLFAERHDGGGLTPLLGRDGKPVIDGCGGGQIGV